MTQATHAAHRQRNSICLQENMDPMAPWTLAFVTDKQNPHEPARFVSRQAPLRACAVDVQALAAEYAPGHTHCLIAAPAHSWCGWRGAFEPRIA
jgi:hypothetical protein